MLVTMDIGSLICMVSELQAIMENMPIRRRNMINKPLVMLLITGIGFHICITWGRWAQARSRVRDLDEAVGASFPLHHCDVDGSLTFGQGLSLSLSIFVPS
mmetsp:Transcript_21021/g.45505  ORF Transcript_21021/g.45505 Transcript_21021/m.45505 type:complete len:101 (-) Transcript_21021:9-311(-)